MENYRRGSEWRKWDLHVHTPASYFWEGGKKLKNMTDEEKVLEIKKFIRTVNESDVAVFCLMDYWTFDWYLELQDYVSKNPNELKKTIFPGIELRIECPADYRLNIHCILSDKLDKQELIDFKSELYIRSIDKKLSDSSLINFAKTLDSSKARKHGYDNPDTLSDEKLLELGSMTAEITKDSLEKAFKQIPTDTGFIILPYDTSDGLLNLDWEKHPHDDNYFMQSAHIFETRDQSNIDLFIGNKTSKNERIFDNFFKTLGKKSKPCISGSDAHRFVGVKGDNNNRGYGDFPSGKATWIKANPTFEGLKQIIYEPKDRVAIQEFNPEEKEDYQIIDKVRFIDNNFMPEEIFLNQNLTVIIGGKSTGKSVLLRNIAQTIDSEEVNKRLTEVGLKEYQNKVTDFRVNWKDTQENKANEENIINKKIIYIPQSYLNRLVDKKEVKSSIDEIIKNILEQEEDIKNVFNELENNNRENEKLITENIENIFYKKEDIVKLTAEIKNIGDKKGIETEIEKLKRDIFDLKDKSNMTEDELKDYSKLENEIKKLKDEREYYEHDFNALEYIKKQEVFTIPFLEKLSSKELQNTLKNKILVIKEKYNIELGKIIDEDISLIKEKLLENNKKFYKNKDLLEPLLKKIIESKSLDEKIKKQLEQEEKLNLIIRKEENLNDLKLEYSKLIKNVSEHSVVFFDNLFNAKTKILNQKSITKTNNLEFGLEVSFKNKSFEESFINNICNLKNIGQFERGFLQNYQFSDKEKLRIDIDKIINGILNDNLVLKSSFSKKDAITKLAQNWFILDFKIKQNGDDISNMSPGKKSFVLLKLLIELDNSKCPILLDQPEDDLDNRSIYNELVQFLKSKKKERQIIIATHNPNLVVGADAECIIVANQYGEESKNKIYKFEYVQGSLENTFKNKEESQILYKQGIQEHVCDILEGGEIAFEKRKKKYNFK